MWDNLDKLYNQDFGSIIRFAPDLDEIIYPDDTPRKLDIKQLDVYERIHGENLFCFVLSEGVSRNTYNFYKIHRELSELYWQIVYTWSDYEDYLDYEKPFEKWEKKPKFF
jgi:hypothetical protein